MICKLFNDTGILWHDWDDASSTMNGYPVWIIWRNTAVSQLISWEDPSFIFLIFIRLPLKQHFPFSIKTIPLTQFHTRSIHLVNRHCRSDSFLARMFFHLQGSSSELVQLSEFKKVRIGSRRYTSNDHRVFEDSSCTSPYGEFTQFKPMHKVPIIMPNAKGAAWKMIACQRRP